MRRIRKGTRKKERTKRKQKEENEGMEKKDWY